MLMHCLKCWTNIESTNPNVARTKNERVMLFLKCAVSGSKKSSELLSSLVIKTHLSKIPLVGPILF